MLLLYHHQNAPIGSRNIMCIFHKMIYLEPMIGDQLKNSYVDFIIQLNPTLGEDLKYE